MGSASIPTLRKRIERNLQKWREALAALQEQCVHPNAVRVPKADTGNWDSGQDSYWFDCTCADCGKHWTIPQ